jgi:hypothetical protein
MKVLYFPQVAKFIENLDNDSKSEIISAIDILKNKNNLVGVSDSKNKKTTNKKRKKIKLVSHEDFKKKLLKNSSFRKYHKSKESEKPPLK